MIVNKHMPPLISAVLRNATGADVLRGWRRVDIVVAIDPGELIRMLGECVLRQTMMFLKREE